MMNIQIQHNRLQEEQSKQDKVSGGKTESILANKCKISSNLNNL